MRLELEFEMNVSFEWHLKQFFYPHFASCAFSSLSVNKNHCTTSLQCFDVKQTIATILIDTNSNHPSNNNIFFFTLLSSCIFLLSRHTRVHSKYEKDLKCVNRLLISSGGFNYRIFHVLHFVVFSFSGKIMWHEFQLECNSSRKFHQHHF